MERTFHDGTAGALQYAFAGERELLISQGASKRTAPIPGFFEKPEDGAPKEWGLSTMGLLEYALSDTISLGKEPLLDEESFG